MSKSNAYSFFIDTSYQIRKTGKKLRDWYRGLTKNSPEGGVCYVQFFNRKSPCPGCPVAASLASKKIERTTLMDVNIADGRQVISTPLPEEDDTVRLVYVDCMSDIIKAGAAGAAPPQLVVFDQDFNVLSSHPATSGASLLEFFPNIKTEIESFFQKDDFSASLPAELFADAQPHCLYKTFSANGKAIAILCQNPLDTSDQDHMHRIVALSQFASHVSHEVKNPLSILLTHLDIMRNEIVNVTSLEGVYKLQDHVDTIQYQIDYILRILDSVSALKIHKQESIIELDLYELLQGVSSILLFKKPHAGNWFKIDSSREIPPIQASELAMERAISELVLELWRQGGESCGVELKITFDASEGIFYLDFEMPDITLPHCDWDKLLDEFYEKQPHLDYQNVGMLIAYATIVNHGGEMSLTSAGKNGSTVHVKLPQTPTRTPSNKE